jgi:acyl-CoA reductase-like NAD-dependent aldehyde dehydrogenase
MGWRRWTPRPALNRRGRAHPPRERGEILRRAFAQIMERADELALLMTLEMGKPLAESKAEISYAAARASPRGCVRPHHDGPTKETCPGTWRFPGTFQRVQRDPAGLARRGRRRPGAAGPAGSGRRDLG